MSGVSWADRTRPAAWNEPMASLTLTAPAAFSDSLRAWAAATGRRLGGRGRGTSIGFLSRRSDAATLITSTKVASSSWVLVQVSS